jgi:signal transduction histidine kinase/CheY-like chemotaxis protein
VLAREGGVTPPAVTDNFDLLARMTARLASTANLDEIATIVSNEIVGLGFAAVWVAVLDEVTGNLVTVREIMEGRDSTGAMPHIPIGDLRQPIGRGFHERRMINVPAPDALLILEDHPAGLPEGAMGLPRALHQHLRGNPFACGPLLGSKGQPVGALGLSAYHGRTPLPSRILESGMLAALMNHLGIAMERALHLSRLERLNGELLRTRDLLEAESRMKAVGELAAAVAHDLNNLAGISLMAIHCARSGVLDPRVALPRVERASRAVGDLARRLQRVARTGVDPANVVVDLAQVVEDVVLLIEPLCREEGIGLDLAVDSRAHVAGDATIIKQAVLNVILNAREAVVAGEPYERRIRVRIAPGQDRVVLSVTDSGPGIPAHLLPDLFKPFVSSKTGHAGLGLAIAQTGMKHLGGAIEAGNDPTGGAFFRLSFARVATPAPRPRFAHQATGPRGLRVLAVDDEPEFLIGVEATLRAAGHEVITASDGAEAMSRAREQRMDLVIIDLGLPGKNGLEVVGALRRAGVVSKFILMTGWDTDTLAAASRLSLCDRFLQKPFGGDDLRRVVGELAAPAL